MNNFQIFGWKNLAFDVKKIHLIYTDSVSSAMIFRDLADPQNPFLLKFKHL